MVSEQSGNMDGVQTTSGKFGAWQSKDFMLLLDGENLRYFSSIACR